MTVPDVNHHIEEEERNKKRKKWLKEITDVGKTSGLSMVPTYNTACAIIEQVLILHTPGSYKENATKCGHLW